MIQYCCADNLEDKPEAVSVYGDEPVPVVPLDALKEKLSEIVGQAHGGAMLGGDDAYQACLKIEAMMQRLLALLERKS